MVLSIVEVRVRIRVESNMYRISTRTCCYQLEGKEKFEVLRYLIRNWRKLNDNYLINILMFDLRPGRHLTIKVSAYGIIVSDEIKS
jgi:hypothetical protein